MPHFHSSHPGEVYQAVSESVMRGDLVIYQLPHITDFGALRGKHGVGLCIIRGPNPHCATDLTPEICNNPAAAKQLLDELGISDKAFLGYLNSQSLYNSYQKQNPLADALNLLASGELLAYKVSLPASAPPPKAVEYLPATTADKPVPLAPESSPTASGSREQQFQLAKTKGSSDQQITARKEVAYSFYEQQGMPPSKIAAHTAGIDFSKPVEVIALPIGKTVNQYQVPGGSQGNYYAEPGILPTELGISPNAKDWKTGKIVAKEISVYETNTEVEVLRSTAAKIDDTWSIPNEVVKTSGGAPQYFTMSSGKFFKK